MKSSEYTIAPPKTRGVAEQTVFIVIIAMSFSHLINDMMQSLIPATYPLMKASLHLSFAQIGLITFVFQLTASIFQPVVGLATDRRPQPYSLAVGMSFTLIGLIVLSRSSSYEEILIAVGLVGLGSSIFHPESSRVAYMAAGRRRGLAQSIFQVGGNTGSAVGPLLAAIVIAGRGRQEVAWFSLGTLLGIVVLVNVGRWYARNYREGKTTRAAREAAERVTLSKAVTAASVIVLLGLIFTKYFYLASMTSYFTFYLIAKFNLSIMASQLYLFVFLLAVAAGTIAGGPLGDRIGRKKVIWASILGSAPFSLALPYANLFWTVVLSVCVGLVIASAFPAIIVYAQELLPGRVGVISGLFYGFAFGMGGIGSAVLGLLADQTSITFVYRICAFLPLLGLIAALLPNIEERRLQRA